MKITLSHNIFVHEPHFTFDTFLIIGNSSDFPIKWLLENHVDTIIKLLLNMKE